MTESSPYFRPMGTSGANGNCGKSPEMTDKRMKAKYLKIRFQVLDWPLQHQSVGRNQIPGLDGSHRLLKQPEA
jgi:hypothetical protein